MTRTEIESFRFRSESVQEDWDEKAPKLYDELMGWIKDVKNEPMKNDTITLQNWMVKAMHCLARLSDIQVEAQNWVDIARSEYVSMAMNFRMENPKATSDMVEDMEEGAVGPPEYLRNCANKFYDALEKGLNGAQSILKAGKWQPT
ncbi:MAG: hypothetical protein WC433_01845 [Candidatus Omnitrophota bacterium]